LILSNRSYAPVLFSLSDVLEDSVSTSIVFVGITTKNLHYNYNIFSLDETIIFNLNQKR